MTDGLDMYELYTSLSDSEGNLLVDYRPVELKEKSLKFGDLASTRKYCMESMEIENAVLKALSETDNYRIKDNKLELRKGSQTLATFAIAN